MRGVQSEELRKEYNSLPEKANAWTTISNLNKLYKVDRILLKFAYDTYPDKHALQTSSQYQDIEKFYRNVLDRLFEIERQYLADENDASTPYQVNKNSTSKFIRDENQHYKQIFKQFAQKLNEDELGINGVKVYDFIAKLFDTKYTAIMVDGQAYFGNKLRGERVKQLEETVKMYYVISKDADEADFVLGNSWISEDQMLDFLSYWLKNKEEQHFYVLYSRTEEKLQQDLSKLIQQAQQNKQQKGQPKNPPVHPNQLEANIKQTKFEVDQNEDQEKTGRKIQSQEQNEFMQIKQKNVQSSNFPDILKKYRNIRAQEEEQLPKPPTPRPQPTKREQVETKIKQIFKAGCRRRYVVSKATTFDQIQNEGKTMNLEKFMSFCLHQKISEIVSKELLSQLFKMYAYNRLTIDEQKFKIIMDRVMDTEEKVVDLLLKKYDSNKKLRQKNLSVVSDYKFKLRPVNGKDPKTLKNELQEIKIARSKSREQKLNMFYLRRKQLKEGELPGKKKQIAVSSSRFPDKTSLFEIENIRDNSFDPEKFFSNDFDELLNNYQSRMEKRQETPVQPGLESVLSKRIERGARVVRKITQKNLKLYQ